MTLDQLFAIYRRPWRVEAEGIVSADGSVVQLRDVPLSLIAAVPDLLAALKTARSCLESPSGETIRQIDDAIAKAGG